MADHDDSKPDPIARRPRAKRRLHFAVSTALLVGPMAVAGPACGPQETGNTTAPPEPRINVPPDPEETSNPVEIEEPPMEEGNTPAPPEPTEPPEEQETANPVETEEPPPEPAETTPVRPRPRTNVPAMPMPTMNPVARDPELDEL